MTRTNTPWDRIILGVACVATSGAVMSILFGQAGFNYLDGSPRYEAALGVVYTSIFIWALIHLQEVLDTLRRSRALSFLLALVLLSPFWAQLPSLAFRRAVALMGGTMIGVLLAARFSSSERLRLLSNVLRLLTIGSLVFAVFLPSYGVSSDPLFVGAWMGMFNQKNGLGAYATLSLLVDAYTRRQRIWSGVFWFGLDVILILKSHSASPLVAVLVTWVLVQLFNRMRRRHHMSVRAIIILTAGSVGSCVVVGLASGAVQKVLGRSADLSGRTELWQALIPVILEHPLFGYGYGAFWAGASHEYFTVLRQINWSPMYAHNGYLELMVSLGLVGLLLSSWFVGESGFYAIRRADHPRSQADLFPLALLIYMLIRNFTEVTILYHNNMEWAVYVATFLGVLPKRGRNSRLSSPEQPEDPMSSTSEEGHA